MNAEEFVLAYCEFDRMPRSLISMMLEESAQDCPLEIWGDRQKRGIAMLSGHRLAVHLMQLGATASSAIEAAKGGTQSLPSGESVELGATYYGREFLRLRDSLPITGFVV